MMRAVNGMTETGEPEVDAMATESYGGQGSVVPMGGGAESPTSPNPAYLDSRTSSNSSTQNQRRQTVFVPPTPRPPVPPHDHELGRDTAMYQDDSEFGVVARKRMSVSLGGRMALPQTNGNLHADRNHTVAGDGMGAGRGRGAVRGGGSRRGPRGGQFATFPVRARGEYTPIDVHARNRTAYSANGVGGGEPTSAVSPISPTNYDDDDDYGVVEDLEQLQEEDEPVPEYSPPLPRRDRSSHVGAGMQRTHDSGSSSNSSDSFRKGGGKKGNAGSSRMRVSNYGDHDEVEAEYGYPYGDTIEEEEEEEYGEADRMRSDSYYQPTDAKRPAATPHQPHAYRHPTTQRDTMQNNTTDSYHSRGRGVTLVDPAEYARRDRKDDRKLNASNSRDRERDTTAAAAQMSESDQSSNERYGAGKRATGRDRNEYYDSRSRSLTPEPSPDAALNAFIADMSSRTSQDRDQHQSQSRSQNQNHGRKSAYYHDPRNLSPIPDDRGDEDSSDMIASPRLSMHHARPASSASSPLSPDSAPSISPSVVVDEDTPPEYSPSALGSASPYSPSSPQEYSSHARMMSSGVAGRQPRRSVSVSASSNGSGFGYGGSGKNPAGPRPLSTIAPSSLTAAQKMRMKSNPSMSHARTVREEPGENDEEEYGSRSGNPPGARGNGSSDSSIARPNGTHSIPHISVSSPRTPSTAPLNSADEYDLIAAYGGSDGDPASAGVEENRDYGHRGGREGWGSESRAIQNSEHGVCRYDGMVGTFILEEDLR